MLESVLSINLVCDLASFDRHMNSSPLPRFTKLIRLAEQPCPVRPRSLSQDGAVSDAVVFSRCSFLARALILS